MYRSQGLEASNFVGEVDKAYVIIMGISLFFLVSLTVIMIWFVYRYHEKRNKVATQIPGSTRLEILWTVIPTLLVLLMFYYGWIAYRPMRNPPPDAMKVTSVARMWSFSFEYENGKRSDKLILPVNKPVNIDLLSVDVIHSLFIPAFRVKEDMVPGIDKFMWFTPTNIGTYDVFCAEYCGLQHSYMSSTVEVLSEEDFNAWYVDTSAVIAGDPNMPGAAGFALLQVNGCNACHTSDGSRLVGPSHQGLYGQSRMVLRGRDKVEVVADEEYIRRSIYEPEYEIVEGFQKGLMQSYKDVLSEDDINLIIEYLKTLNEQ